jgi:hypothetical protein
VPSCPDYLAARKVTLRLELVCLAADRSTPPNPPNPHRPSISRARPGDLKTRIRVADARAPAPAADRHPSHGSARRGSSHTHSPCHPPKFRWRPAPSRRGPPPRGPHEGRDMSTRGWRRPAGRPAAHTEGPLGRRQILATASVTAPVTASRSRRWKRVEGLHAATSLLDRCACCDTRAPTTASSTGSTAGSGLARAATGGPADPLRHPQRGMIRPRLHATHGTAGCGADPDRAPGAGRGAAAQRKAKLHRRPRAQLMHLACTARRRRRAGPARQGPWALGGPAGGGARPGASLSAFAHAPLGASSGGPGWNRGP